MYFSITFGEKNTWDDWHIVPTSRPLVNPPEVKTEYVNIPGANGTLDFTDVLAGVKYNNREGSWEFIVLNGYQEWHELYNEILNYLHGKKMSIILESEPGKEYYGRLFLESWNSEKDFSKLTIKYIIDTYTEPEGTDPEEGTRELKILSYIASTGTQYIDTGMKLSPAYNVEVIAGMDESYLLDPTAWDTIFGSRYNTDERYTMRFANSTNGNLQAQRTYDIGSTYYQTWDLNWGSGPTYVRKNLMYSTPSIAYMKFVLGSTCLLYQWAGDMNYVDDSTKGSWFLLNSYNFHDFGSERVTTKFRNNLYLFALNNNDGTPADFGHIRIKDFKIKLNNVVQMHLVPVKTPEGTICMFDTEYLLDTTHERQALFLNQGTNDFVGGAETGKTITIE